ncbi:MAG: TonB-dependent receptor [Candidatus Marinimicrobia bacterium]|nr:TonB-dependent receptor [Candidatus Neomarinimicrobiota bacterium]
MKKIFTQKTLKYVLILSFISSNLSNLLGNTPTSKPLNGRVTDSANSRSIPTVNVMINELGIGDVSDENGEYEFLNLASGLYTLTFSHIGFESKTISVNYPQQTKIEIQLEESFFQMDQVVVTSTRTEKIHRNVPVATEVITKKDIHDSGAMDVGELLAQRSGISISNTVTGESVVSLMGMDGKYVLILLDGRPVTGKFNGRVSLDQIPTNLLKKVEIIKGPNSALYGSEAMGGVINFITEDADTKTNYSITSRFSSGDGSFNPVDKDAGRRNVRINVSRRWKDISIHGDLDYHVINMDDENLHINVDDIKKVTSRSWLKWDVKANHKIALDFTYYGDSEANKTSTVEAVTHVNRINPIVEYSWNVNDVWKLDQSLRFSSYIRSYDQKRPWGTPISSDTTGELESEYELNIIRVKEKSTLNLGTEIVNADYISNRILSGQRSLRSRSVFGQYDFKPFSNINTVVGTRLDNNNEVGTVLSPRLAIMANFGMRWKLRSTVGKGFRMPAFVDRYIDWTHEAFGYHIIGNPDLKPEKSTGYTLGLEYYHPLVYQISIMVYRTNFTNMINDYVVEPNVFSYENIDRVQYNGMEIQGRWTISNSWITSWGMNYIDNRDMSTWGLIPNTKPFSMSFRVSYQHPKNRFKASLRTKFTGSYFTHEYLPELGDFEKSDIPRKPFTITEVTSSYKILPTLTLFGGIKNLTDITDEVHGPFIGRRYFIELNLNIHGE